MTPEPLMILPAEHFGTARSEDGILDIGGVKVPYSEDCTGSVSVYVRRLSSDLSIMEIQLARHDGLAQEQLDAQNDEAENDPRGPKEYWRAKMVGHFTYGADGHLMTDAEFEADWDE